MAENSDLPRCSRCLEWKNKGDGYGVCWVNAAEPMWTRRVDVCNRFSQKVIWVTRDELQPVPEKQN